MDKFKRAFEHPIRVAILERFSEANFTPQMLAADLNESLTQVTYHVAVLCRLGFLRRILEEDQVLREGGHLYGLVDPVTFAHFGQLRIPNVAADHLIATLIRRMVDEAQLALIAGNIDDPQNHFLCTTFQVDREAHEAIVATLDVLLERLSSIVAESERRNVDEVGDEMIPMTLAVASFKSPPKDTSREKD